MAEIEMEIHIAAPPERVFEAFINETGRWWSKDFTMGGKDTSDIVLEAHPGGRLLEQFSNGGGNVWAIVMGINPGKSIRMGIPDGVIWSGAGSFSLRFEADGD